jgi:hypothetical protein
MLRNLKFPALILGALMAILGPAAYAADRGGPGGGGHAQSFSRGSVGHSNVGRSSGAARSFNNGRQEFRGGERFRGGDRDRYYGGYYGRPAFGFYYGSPYGYGYPYSGCGYYDQWGRWIADPYCYGY